ncbi:hypothetical protein GF314_11095 [bacterium]|nr:hypothetical protein [bacterium]
MSAGRQGPFVEPRAVLERRRELPIRGRVLLEVGDRVDRDTVVASARTRGAMHTVNAAVQLDIPGAELPRSMLRAVGDEVAAGEPLARSRGFFGLLASECRAPVAGTIAAVSAHTGRILLEEPGDLVEVRAFLPGIVTACEPERGVTVAGWAARVAGVFGVGGEVAAELVPAVGRADATLEAAALDERHAGTILLGGAVVDAAALARATELGVAGLVTGGVHDAALARWLGRETVLADTTGLAAPFTLVIVGGFGRVPMTEETFDLLRSHAGRVVGLSGHTRVRAGALRPEAIVPLDEVPDARPAATRPPALSPGCTVQVVRAPWFGHRGRVGALPDEPVRVESGARCLVAHVDLDAGVTAVVPRANLEVLAGPETPEVT